MPVSQERGQKFSLRQIAEMAFPRGAALAVIPVLLLLGCQKSPEAKIPHEADLVEAPPADSKIDEVSTSDDRAEEWLDSK